MVELLSGRERSLVFSFSEFGAEWNPYAAARFEHGRCSLTTFLY